MSFTENNQIAVLKDFTGTTTTLNFDIKGKHSSIRIVVYKRGVPPEVIIIGSNQSKSYPSKDLEKIEIEHRNKFIIRYRQKLYDSTPERIKGSGRVTISSGNSGNTTTTTVQST